MSQERFRDTTYPTHLQTPKTDVCMEKKNHACVCKCLSLKIMMMTIIIKTMTPITIFAAIVWVSFFSVSQNEPLQ